MQPVSLQFCPLVAQSSFLCGASSCVDTISISLEGQSPCRCSLSLMAEPHSMQVQPSPTHRGSVCVDMVLCNGTTCGFRLLMSSQVTQVAWSLQLGLHLSRLLLSLLQHLLIQLWAQLSTGTSVPTQGLCLLRVWADGSTACLHLCYVRLDLRH